MARIYHYFVEGDCELRLINSLKVPPYNYFTPGKVEVFNVISQRLTKNRITVLNPNTIIFFVYDTDILKKEILEENISLLNKFGFKKIYHIQSIKNFEDEVVFSSKIKSITEVFNTSNVSEFKTKFLHQTSIVKNLEKIKFDKSKIWTRIDNNYFAKYSNFNGNKYIRN